MSAVLKLLLLRKFWLQVIFALTLMPLLIAQVPAQGAENKTTGKQGALSSEYVTIQWTDLLPQDEVDILSNPPDYLNDIEDGSAEDQLNSPMNNSIVVEMEDRYQQALVSTRVKSEMDGRAVRIPGFIVPIEFNGEQTITEFFLVPYFGACLHMPPPPPNQIIYVKSAEGLKLEALYYPFWISGDLKASMVENDMATAAYSMEMNNYEAYQQE
ncbi:MAG: DUF3299 domain-containing protein [Porticoccaceae bacterium]|nr:DUF3299 domain-containing protein [Porticoccaceae bacterium]